MSLLIHLYSCKGLSFFLFQSGAEPLQVVKPIQFYPIIKQGQLMDTLSDVSVLCCV